MNTKYVKIRIDGEVVGISKYPERLSVRISLGKYKPIGISEFDLEKINETEYTTLEAFGIPSFLPDKRHFIDLSSVVSKK
jgi:hypothetical protein